MSTDSARPQPAGELPPSPAPLTLERAGAILWETAWESALAAFMVLILGSLAVGMVGGILNDMVPSLPSAAAKHVNAEAAGSPQWAAFRNFFEQNQFAIIFALLFIGKAAARLIHHSPVEKHRRTAARIQLVAERISGDWFSLIVANAFTAMVTVMVLGWVQNFSLTHFVWQLILDLCQPLIHAVAGFFLHGGVLNFLGGLIAWYGDNQIKFTFWLVYTAAICDDLGLPNFKTLIRFARRRCFQRKHQEGPAVSPT